MRRSLLYVVCSISIISLFLLMMCREIPTNPSEDYNNVNATLITVNGSGINYQDQAVQFGIIIKYPNMAKQVRVFYPDNILSDTFAVTALDDKVYDTLKTIRTFTTFGKKTINIDVVLENNTVKQFSQIIEIAPKQLSVSFDTMPQLSDTVTIGKPDTMTFVASTSPAGGAIVFTAESQPALDESGLKIISTGSKALLIVTTSRDTVYNITLTAKSGTDLKKATIRVVSEPKIRLQETSSVKAMPSGTIDTLVFTVETSETDTVNSMKLLNAEIFKTGEIVSINKGVDTLCFVFTPSEVKVYVFSVEAVINNKKETITYSIAVAKETALLLKQDTVTISAVEGALINLSVVSFLSDTTVQLSVNKGMIDNKKLVFQVPFGSVRDTVTVTAQKNSDMSRIKIYINISASDTVKPLLTRVFPLDSVLTTYTSSFTCKVKVSDAAAGIRNVSFTAGSALFVDSSVHRDSIYQCVITNLVKGQRTAIKIRATDKSIGKNSDSITVYVTYDPPVTDTVKPVITLVNPIKDSSKVSSSSLSVEVSCKDSSGIREVTCMLGTIAIPVAKGTGSSFIASVSGLTAGINVLTFKATDSSSNVSVMPVTIIYDPAMADNVPPVVSLKNPLTNGAVVLKDTITVIVSCKDESGVASVTCTFAGTPVAVVKSSDSLYSALVTGLTSGKDDTITFVATDSSAKANKSAFPVIVKYTKFSVTYIGNGSTGGTVPVDANKYAAGAPVTAAAAGTLVKAGSTFTGWNTVAAGTGTAHAAGSIYAIGAANDTLYAQWTANPTFTVTYNGNGSTGGTLPVDANSYPAGASVTAAAAGTLVKTGSTFTGWNTKAAGTGTAHAAGSIYAIGAANDTLYAQWTLSTYTVVYTLNGGTNNAANPATYTILTPTITLSAPTKAGNLFGGWYSNSTFSGLAVTAIPLGTTGEISLFAKWIKTYTLTYDGNGSTVGSAPDEGTFDSNAVVIVAGNTGAMKKMGQDFNGWNTKADGSGTVLAVAATFKIKSDMTLYAQWVIKKYTLTISTPVNGTVNLSGNVSVDSGAVTTITAAPSSGYKFKQWNVTTGSATITSSTSASTAVRLTQGNATIQAVFVCLTFVKQLQMQQYSELSLKDIIQTDDGGYMAAGTINSISGVNLMGIAIKLNQNGDTTWTRTFSAVSVSSIKKAAAGYVITGTGTVDDNYIDLVCYAQNGNQPWSHSYFKSGYSYTGSSARITKDNGYIIGGSTNYNFFLVKLNASRSITWEYEYDAGGIDNLNDCIQTADDGYMMIGQANMGSNSCAIKIDDQGIKKWSSYFSSELGTNGLSNANSVELMSDGDCIIGGSVYGGATSEGYLLKVSQTGTVNMFKKYSNSYSIISAQPKSDGYIFAGSTQLIGQGQNDIYIARTNSSGTIIKEATYGTTGDEYCTSMNLTSDGGCIITGGENWIIKTDENGENP